MKVLVLSGSSRDHGNTDALAARVVAGLDRTTIPLRELNILPIRDQRHEEGGFQPLDDEYEAVVEQVLKHEVLVFATPIYWYGMSGSMKDFVDRWSQSLRNRDYDFKGALAQKQAYVVITGGDQPRLKGLPLIQQFQYIFDFVGMKFAGYVIGEANKPGDIEHDLRALQEADHINAKLRALACTNA